MKQNFMAMMAFFGKFGPKILGLIGKFAKLGLAGASLAGYAMLFTWQFGVVILAAIGFHESGHVWAMRRCGIKTKGFYFIPFLGGAAVAEEDFKTRANEAFIGIMGPVWGFALAIVAYLIYLLTHNPLFAAITGWMALINLINLLPINPLDGGRISKSIVFSINSTFGMIFLAIGVIAMIYFAVKLHFFLFLILLFFGAVELVQEQQDYLFNRVKAKFFPISELHGLYKPAMSVKQGFLTFFGYTGLIGAFIYLMSLTSHIPGSAAAMEALLDSHPETATAATQASSPWWVIVLLAIVFLAALYMVYTLIHKLITNVIKARKLELALTKAQEFMQDVPTLIDSLMRPDDNKADAGYPQLMAQRFLTDVLLPISDDGQVLMVVKDYFGFQMGQFAGFRNSIKTSAEPVPA